MVIKTIKGKYKCTICNKVYDRDKEAYKCKQSHNVLYVPLTPEDISSIIKYIYFPDQKGLISERLLKHLRKWNKIATKKEM